MQNSLRAKKDVIPFHTLAWIEIPDNPQNMWLSTTEKDSVRMFSITKSTTKSLEFFVFSSSQNFAFVKFGSHRKVPKTAAHVL